MKIENIKLGFVLAAVFTLISTSASLSQANQAKMDKVLTETYMSSNGVLVETLDTNTITCGPVVKYEIPNKGTLKIRYMYTEEKTIYSLYSPRKTKETIAFVSNGNGFDSSGVLDLFATKKGESLKVGINREYLVVEHKYGKNFVSLERLFTEKNPEYDASQFYRGYNICVEDMIK